VSATSRSSLCGRHLDQPSGPRWEHVDETMTAGAVVEPLRGGHVMNTAVPGDLLANL
jgi:hypothetical protein